jgi:hypothetical protein
MAHIRQKFLSVLCLFWHQVMLLTSHIDFYYQTLAIGLQVIPDLKWVEAFMLPTIATLYLERVTFVLIFQNKMFPSQSLSRKKKCNLTSIWNGAAGYKGKDPFHVP